MENSHDQYSQEIAQSLSNSTNIASGINQTYFLVIIVAVSLAFLCISLLMTVYMIRRRKKELKRTECEKSLINKYQKFLSNMIILPNLGDDIYQTTNESSVTERLELADISDPNRRKILIQEVYSFKQYLQGNQAAQLVSYFFGLGLQVDVASMLSHNSWTEKLAALKYVLAFDLKECLPQTSELVRHHNQDLAFQAMLTKLSLENDFESIWVVYSELNNWEKHKLHDLANHQGINIDDYLTQDCVNLTEELASI